MTDTPPVPPTTDPPKADPAPAPAAQPAPAAPVGLTDADGFLGRLTAAMDTRFDKLAGRLETQLRPPAPPEPEKIEAPEHVEPKPAEPDSAPKAKKHWYYGR